MDSQPVSPVAGRADRPVRVVVVDDDPFVLTALRSYLGSEPGIEVLSTFTQAREALAFLQRVRADVVVSDVRMPGMDGLELLTRLKEQAPDTAVLMLTSFDDDTALRESLAQRANGFLLKDSAPEEVVRAVLAAADGGTTISPTTASRLVSRFLRPATPSLPNVTAAEQAVLDLLCEGYSNGEIAERLVISEATVKTHVSRLMKKLNVPSRLKLVVAVLHARDAAR